MGKKAKTEKRAAHDNWANRNKPKENPIQEYRKEFKLPSIRKQYVGTVYTKSENVLPDDYPVYPGYLYIMDGYIVEAPSRGTVATLKGIGIREEGKGEEVRRCDISGRW